MQGQADPRERADCCSARFGTQAARDKLHSWQGARKEMLGRKACLSFRHSNTLTALSPSSVAARGLCAGTVAPSASSFRPFAKKVPTNPLGPFPDRHHAFRARRGFSCTTTLSLTPVSLQSLELLSSVMGFPHLCEMKPRRRQRDASDRLCQIMRPACTDSGSGPFFPSSLSPELPDAAATAQLGSTPARRAPPAPFRRAVAVTADGGDDCIRRQQVKQHPFLQGS